MTQMDTDIPPKGGMKTYTLKSHQHDSGSVRTSHQQSLLFRHQLYSSVSSRQVRTGPALFVEGMKTR